MAPRSTPQQQAAKHDGRFVTIGPLVFFSTETGDALADAKLPITPAKLATRALTGYPTALRWLKIHHPELLVPKQEAPPDTVPTEQVPQTTTHAKSLSGKWSWGNAFASWGIIAGYDLGTLSD